MAATLAGLPQRPAGPTILSLRLPDGDEWTLGPRAIGRPFLARITLTNEGDAPIVLWDPDNSEGSACASVTLTDEAGRSTVLRPRPMRRAGGGPTVVSVPPSRVLIYDLELLRLVGPESLPPGRYTVTPSYENDRKSSPPMPEVWTGKVQGEPQAIRIVLPEP